MAHIFRRRSVLAVSAGGARGAGVQHDYLDEFYAVAKCGTLSGTAKRLGVSQPSLGRHLSCLETELGVRLLDRGPSGVRLTAAGERAFAVAEQMAGLEDSLVEHFADPERRARERVLAVACSYLDDYMRRLLSKTCEQLKLEDYAVRLEVSKLPADEDAARLVQERAIDVAICLRAQAPDSVHTVGCFEAPLCSMGAGVVSRGSAGPEPSDAAADAAAADAQAVADGSLCLEDVLDEVFTLGREPGQHALWDEFLRVCDARGLAAPAMRAPRRTGAAGAGTARPGDVRLCVCDPLRPATPSVGERVRQIRDLSFETVVLGRADDELVRRAAQIARDLASAASAPQPASQRSMYVSVPKSDAAVGTLGLPERGECLARVLDEPKVTQDLVLPDGTVVDKVYVALRNRLNRIGDGLSGDPVSTSFEAIMRLWSREEAQAYLEMPMLEYFTAYDFSVRSGRDLAQCERICEELSRRNLICRVTRGGVVRYFLLAWTYGIWEFMVKNYEKGFLSWGIYGYDLGSASQFPTMRVCPVGPEVVRGGALSPYWDWWSLLLRQDLVCIAPCQCQASCEVEAGIVPAGIDGQRGLCLTFGDMARYWMENGTGQLLEKGEAMERALVAAYENGCIPQVIYSRNPEVMCFCDARYCHVFAGVQATYGESPSMPLSSAYGLQVDASRCTGCGTCAGACPMHAVSMGVDGAVVTGPTCVDCGQCVLACTFGARVLVAKPRGSEPPLPEDLLEDYRWRSEDRMARGYISDFAQPHIDLWAAM